MGAGRLDTAGASWSVQLTTAPSSLQPALLHSGACSSLSCRSPSSLAVVVVERAQLSTGCHVSALCSPRGQGHVPLLTHLPRGPLLALLWSLLSRLSTAALGGRLQPIPVHLLCPGLSVLAPGASQSVDQGLNTCSGLSGLSRSLSQCCPPLPCPHPCSTLIPSFC